MDRRAWLRRAAWWLGPGSALAVLLARLARASSAGGLVRLGVGKDEDAGGWWDPGGEGVCVWCAYQAKGAASFNDSLTDLSGNGNDAGDPGAPNTPAWDAVNGWTFDGIQDYLTTTFVPENDQSQSVLVQYTSVTNNGYIFGARSPVAAGNWIIQPDDASNRVWYFNGGTTLVLPCLLAGNLGIAGSQGYRTGVADGGAIGAWVGASTITTYIGARNNNGVVDSFCAASIQAFALFDCVLTPGQMLARATAMAAI